MYFIRYFGIVALVCTISACNGGSSNSTPPAPNASQTTITVTTSSGAPISEIVVTLSTGLTNGNALGTIASERTDGGGQVIFRNLPSLGQLCVSTANAVGVQVFRANHCADPFPATYTLKFSSKMPGN